jgi:anti-sigma regulatory factor (Ser/Thr protein kinase)
MVAQSARQYRSVFSSEMASVADVRAFVRSCVADIAIEVDDAVLAVSELATNAVEHGSGATFSVELEMTSEAVDVVVDSERDRAWVTPPTAAADTGPIPRTGRGLRIVAAVADEVEFDDARPNRLRAHCRFRIAAAG